MGLLLEKYEKKYLKAISGAKPGDYVVKPEIWIASQWTVDADFTPWGEDRYDKIRDLYIDDPELCEVVTKGLREMVEKVQETCDE